jgi:hypothetical protein
MICAKQKLIQLCLLVLMLALLIAPVAGAVATAAGVDAKNHSTLFEAKRIDKAPTAVIACNGGSASGSSCGGG